MVRCSAQTASVRIPTLYFIGGDTTGEGPLVRTTFKSNYNMLCLRAGAQETFNSDGPPKAVNRAGVKSCNCTKVECKQKDGEKVCKDALMECQEEQKVGGCLEYYFQREIKKNIICGHPFEVTAESGSSTVIGISDWNVGDVGKGTKASTLPNKKKLGDVRVSPLNTQCGGYQKPDGHKGKFQPTDSETVLADWNQTGELNFKNRYFKLYRVFVNDSKSERYEYHALSHGCVCETSEYYGEFCQIKNLAYEGWAKRSACFNLAGHVVAVVLASCLSMSRHW